MQRSEPHLKFRPRPKRRRNRQVQEIRTQSPAIERKSSEKCLWLGWWKTRADKISRSFIFASLTHTHPIDAVSIQSLTNTTHSAVKIVFSVIQFHSTWFSPAFWFQSIMWICFMLFLRTDTHSQAKAANCVSTVGRQDEERFSRLQGFAWNFLMVVEAKNGRRNIWFREGWDFYVFGYRFHLHAEPMGTKSVSFNSYFSIFCAMHRWINFSGRYKRTGDVQRVPKKSAGEIGFLCSPLISHKLELFRLLDKTARRAICLIRLCEDW